MVRTYHRHSDVLLPPKPERSAPVKPRRSLRTECLAAAMIIGFLAMFVTWGSSAIVKAGYELVQARACLTRLEKENELLRLEMAQLKSPQRIQNIAVKQLGMIKPHAVYMADKNSSGTKPVKDGTRETVAVRRSILFGDARAEAHNIR